MADSRMFAHHQFIRINQSETDAAGRMQAIAAEELQQHAPQKPR
jgi:hypothetical protein